MSIGSANNPGPRLLPCSSESNGRSGHNGKYLAVLNSASAYALSLLTLGRLYEANTPRSRMALRSEGASADDRGCSHTGRHGERSTALVLKAFAGRRSVISPDRANSATQQECHETVHGAVGAPDLQHRNICRVAQGSVRLSMRSFNG
jgi:hypothetical protein